MAQANLTRGKLHVCVARLQLIIYRPTKIFLGSVCRSYQTAGRNSCSIISGDDLVRPSFFYTRKTPRNYHEDRVPHKCLLNEPASDPSKRGVTPVTVDRQRPANNMIGDNCGQIDPKRRKATSQMATTKFIPSRHDKCGLGIITNHTRLFVKINNEEWFLMLSRMKIHNILFLDGLSCDT